MQFVCRSSGVLAIGSFFDIDVDFRNQHDKINSQVVKVCGIDSIKSEPWVGPGCSMGTTLTWLVIVDILIASKSDRFISRLVSDDILGICSSYNTVDLHTSRISNRDIVGASLVLFRIVHSMCDVACYIRTRLIEFLSHVMGNLLGLGFSDEGFNLPRYGRPYQGLIADHDWMVGYRIYLISRRDEVESRLWFYCNCCYLYD